MGGEGTGGIYKETKEVHKETKNLEPSILRPSHSISISSNQHSRTTSNARDRVGPAFTAQEKDRCSTKEGGQAGTEGEVGNSFNWIKTARFVPLGQYGKSKHPEW